MSFTHDHPHGSARFAESHEVRRAFRKKGGLPVGFYRRQMLTHSGQAGALLIGGAGSGKFTTMLAHIMGAQGRRGEPARYAFLDPKGEMAAVIGLGLVHRGAHAYFINAYRLHDLTDPSVALYSHLVPGSPTLVADSRRAARTLLPESGGADAMFFDQTGQNWTDAPMRGLLHADGCVSPLCIYELIGMMRRAPGGRVQRSRLLYTSDAADDLLCVDLGGRRIIKKKKKKQKQNKNTIYYHT